MMRAYWIAYTVVITAYCLFLAVAYEIHKGEIGVLEASVTYWRADADRWKHHSSRLIQEWRTLCTGSTADTDGCIVTRVR